MFPPSAEKPFQRFPLILLFLKGRRKQAQDQPRDKQEDPGEQVHDPPPPADQQPPETAMAFLLVFRHRSGSSNRTVVFLKCIYIDISASAFRAVHS